MPPKRPTHAHGNEPETTNREEAGAHLPALPSLERIQQELASATNLNDFFGKDGIFARLFATTVEQMLEAELTTHLGYPPYAADGRKANVPAQGRTVQYFERQRFELQGENAPPYDVLLGLLGEEVLQQQGIDWHTQSTSPGPAANCLWFQQTQHNVCD